MPPRHQYTNPPAGGHKTIVISFFSEWRKLYTLTKHFLIIRIFTL